MLGPYCWCIFLGDLADAVQKVGYEELLFADDVLADAEFHVDVDTEVILASLDRVQTESHTWGHGNSVQFEASKEGKHRVCARAPLGAFKYLGINFDAALTMRDEIERIASKAHGQVRAILRVGQNYTLEEVMLLY